MRTLPFIFLLLVTLSSSQASDAETALRLYEAARTGDSKAHQQLLKRAEKGQPMAQHVLGMMLIKGEGVLRDAEQAVNWFRKAAEQGLPYSQLSLGTLYSQGDGVPKDLEQAARWMRQAAEQSFAPAQAALGEMHAKGSGVTKDTSVAAAWYSKAAIQGDPQAMASLGWLFETGDGVPKNFVSAYALYNVAAARGNVDAKLRRENLESRMSPQDVAEAQRRSMKAMDPEPDSQPAPASGARNTRVFEAITAIGVEMMRQGALRDEANRRDATLTSSCGIRPLEMKPMKLGCRDMVQTCSCTSTGTCRWVWTCLP